jgi:uncharacterized protein YneF (UPF0154 family)
MGLENGTVIVIAYVLVSIGVIIGFLVRDCMARQLAARAPLTGNSLSNSVLIRSRAK